MPIETQMVNKPSFWGRLWAPGKPANVSVPSPLIIGAIIWLSFNLFTAITQVSGFARVRTLPLEWDLIFTVLASTGFMVLVFFLISLCKYFVDFLAAKSARLAPFVRRTSVAILISACIAAPVAARWATKYADQMRDAQRSVSVENICPDTRGQAR
ncbi:hypothetical protein [Uliginosibacterium flavum]|uniref:Uncharacterized protein n=1 Tax=Uliginosibacterium flavum TaxID=1396831 RepID=A0ABV2TJC7_9RHOO